MNHPHEKVLKTAQGPVFTRYYPQQAERTLLLIHGNSMSVSSWQPLINHALPQPVNILVFDLPGHGQSPRAEHPADTYSLPSYAAILAEVVRAYAPEHFYLVGHSLGGHIILEAPAVLAASRGALLMGTPPLGIPPRLDLAFQLSPQFLSFMQPDTDRSVLEQTFLSMLPADKTEVARQLLEDYLHTDPAARLHLAQNIQAGRHLDELQVLQQSPVPVTLLRADHDPLVNPAYFDQLLPEREVVTLHGAGHYAPLEQPGAFVERILHSLQGQPA